MITVLQIVALLVAWFFLARYKSDGARYRGGVSAFSGLMMAIAGAWAAALYFGVVPAGPTGLVVALLMMAVVVGCRGNMAKLIDRVRWSRHGRG